MRQTFEIPLDIPDVTIESVTTNRVGHIEITVKSTVEGTPCHQCGKMTTKFYGKAHEITLRHCDYSGPEIVAKQGRSNYDPFYELSNPYRSRHP